MPGRDGRTLQLRMGLDLRRAARGRLHLLGAKLDLRKAFDNVAPELALRVAEALGFPAGVLAMLRSFYDRLRRLFGAAGRADSEWVVAEQRGLLQGCPFSPILMNMVMSLYADKIRKEVAEAFPVASTKLRLSLFIDDRIVWVVGRDLDDVRDVQSHDRR